jgi:hypothetical protein
VTIVCDTCGRSVPALSTVLGLPVAHVDERRGENVEPNAVTPCRSVEDYGYSVDVLTAELDDLDLDEPDDYEPMPGEFLR